MGSHPRTLKVESERDLARAVEAVVADGAPRLLVRDGEAVAVVLSPGDYAELHGEAPATIWDGYDADLARRALHAAAGALAGVDRVTFLGDLRDSRGQASAGRSD